MATVGVLKALTSPGVWTPVGVGGISQVDADSRFVNVDGDTMTGPLSISNAGAYSELIALKSPAATYAYIGYYQNNVRKGWMGAHLTNGDIYVNADTNDLYCVATVGNVNIRAPGAAATVNIRAGSADQVVISSTMVTIPTNIVAIQTPPNFWSPASNHFFFGQLGAITSNGSYRLGFYSNGYRGGPGGTGDWTNFNVNGIVGSAALELDPSGLIYLRAQASAPANSAGAAIVSTVEPLGQGWGRTLAQYATVDGVDIRGDGRIITTTDATTIYNQFIHFGAADAASAIWLSLRRGTTQIGSITQVATTGAAFNTTSHGPFKGNLVDLADDEALARVMLWRPVAYQWRTADGDYDERAEPSGPVCHGFVAQELHSVEPHAVAVGYGTPDEHREWVARQAEYDRVLGVYQAQVEHAVEHDLTPPPPPDIAHPGDDPFQPWGVDGSKLVPDLAAAVQVLIRQNRALTDRINAMENAA